MASGWSRKLVDRRAYYGSGSGDGSNNKYVVASTYATLNTDYPPASHNGELAFVETTTGSWNPLVSTRKSGWYRSNGSAWVETTSDIDVELWGATQAYTISERVLGSDGLIYTCEQNNVGTNPTTDNGAIWARVEDFRINQTAIATKSGRINWDNANQTLSFGVPDGGSIQINQEQFDYYHNLSGTTLVNGDVVSVVGASGNRSAVSLTDPTNATSATACIGMVTVASILNNVVGRITSKGKVRGLNTGGLTEGLPVYVDASNAGKLTQVVPTAPNYFIHVGIVEVAHTTNGVINIDIRVSPRLEDLSDVDGVVPADGDFLSYNGTVWDPKYLYWKDAVADVPSLPAGGNTAGDVRLVQSTRDLYIATSATNWIRYGTPSALTNYLGLWDALTNTPTIVSGTGSAGDWYVVSVAGTTNIDGIASWSAGDYIWFSSDTVTWQKIDNSSAGSGTAAGLQGQIQFNNSGNFGADSGLYWDNTNKRLGIGTTTPNARAVIRTDIAVDSFTPIFGIDNLGTRRIEVHNNGQLSVNLNNTVSEIGSVQFTTPAGSLGFILKNAAATVRSDIKLTSLTTGGLTMGATTTGGAPDTLNLSTAGNVGIDTTAPSAKLHVDGKGGTGVAIKITNGAATGVLSTDGTDLSVDTTGNFILNQRENLSISFRTNATERYLISNAGVHTISGEANIGDVAGGNCSRIETDGTYVALGNATTWVDIDFPIVVRTTGTNIPSLTTFQGNLTVPQWSVNDFNVCESQEFVHSWKEGTAVYFHVHVFTNGLDATNRYLKFEVEYTHAQPMSAFPATTTTASSDLLIPANTPDKTHLVFDLFNFTPSSEKIGGHIVARLRRIASTGTAPTNSPWVPMLQLHVEQDTIGSRAITAK